MTHDEAVERVVAWAREAVPALQSSYTFMVDQKSQALPDVMGDLRDSSIAASDPDFEGLNIQQGYLRIFRIVLSFMVDNRDPSAAADQLRSFADLLGVALLNDATLSGRVQLASPYVTFDFARPFVEYDDGTKGREMTMDISVAELVEA